jgi:aminopeptidase N
MTLLPRRATLSFLLVMGTALCDLPPHRTASASEYIGPLLVHHALRVSLEPQDHRLSAEDTIDLPREIIKENRIIEFELHPGLDPQPSTPGAKIQALDASPQPFMTDGTLLPARYALTLPPGVRRVTLRYGGVIHHPILVQPGDQARGTRDTPGTISEQGIFLDTSSLWFPKLDVDVVNFDMEVRLPHGWDVVSQGSRTIHETHGEQVRVRWEEDHPQPDIYLLAGRYAEYSDVEAVRGAAGSMEDVRRRGPPTTMVFMLEPDSGLARRYLDEAARYIDFYSRLLGPYPYTKFALVENFWETGYGMPSFTALGRTVIRLPFIIESSYPHEILHDWWGNGVYVDLARGNWSEGLTAYLADHLLAERRGQAAAMRRNNLQRYADYVRASDDFPLMQFRARHSPATEAVGYGKAMMFFHMLRREMGDAPFLAGLRDFYRQQLFKFASFEDLRVALQPHADHDLRMEFEQWITRSGAPALRIGGAVSRPVRGGKFRLTFTLEQIQPGAPYLLRVPVAITLADASRAYEVDVPLRAARQEVRLDLSARPLRVEVDPQFDLFRRVDPLEVPPALSGAFGADRVMVVLPSGAPATLRTAYRALAERWREGRDASEFQIISDDSLTELPTDRAVWLFGWENRFLSDLRAALPASARLEQDGLRLPDTDISRAGHAIVLTARRVARLDLGLNWLGSDDPEAMPNLARKLPHYGQFSYVIFSGEAATNVAKGQWPVIDSPLSIAVRQDDGRVIEAPPAKYAPRTALAPQE